MLVELITLPNATTLLEKMTETSAPFFDALFPLAIMVLGITLPILIVMLFLDYLDDKKEDLRRSRAESALESTLAKFKEYQYRHGRYED